MLQAVIELFAVINSKRCKDLAVELGFLILSFQQMVGISSRKLNRLMSNLEFVCSNRWLHLCAILRVDWWWFPWGICMHSVVWFGWYYRNVLAMFLSDILYIKIQIVMLGSIHVILKWRIATASIVDLCSHFLLRGVDYLRILNLISVYSTML